MTQPVNQPPLSPVQLHELIHPVGVALADNLDVGVFESAVLQLSGCTVERLLETYELGVPIPKDEIQLKKLHLFLMTVFLAGRNSIAIEEVSEYVETASAH